MNQGVRNPDRLFLENLTLRRQLARLVEQARHPDPAIAEQARRGLSELVDFLPDATFVVGRDRRVLAWNEACEMLTGVGRESLLGEGDHAYAVPFFGDRRRLLVDLLELPLPSLVPHYSYVRRKGDVLFGEAYLQRLRGGRGAYIWAEASPLCDPQGRNCAAVEIMRDVTEQMHLERALVQSERKHRALFEFAGDSILLVRGDRFVDCNARSLELFGCTREQMIGSAPYLFSPPRQPDGSLSADRAREKIELAIAQGPQSFEWVHCRADGTPFDAEVSLNRLELGGELMLLAIVRDVTQRKRMQDALRDSKAQLSLILNHVSDSIFAIAVDSDERFHFTMVNHCFLETTGLAEDKIVGAHAEDVIPERDRANLLGKYREAIRTKLPVHWEDVSHFETGVKIGYVTIVPVLDARGGCRQLVGMVHDISERKRAEEQVNRLNEDLRRHAEALELRVAERTAQLAARNQELKDFAYTVSHDLKAPLRGIAGYANELERKHREGLSERARFCLSQIMTATSHLDKLIEDLLHYSRLDRRLHPTRMWTCAGWWGRCFGIGSCCCQKARRRSRWTCRPSRSARGSAAWCKSSRT